MVESDRTCPDCHKKLTGHNCAWTLCREEGWVAGKDGVHPNMAVQCDCKYPVKASGVRDEIFKKKYQLLDTNRAATRDAFIYCSKETQGHVYFGTWSHSAKGNGTTADNWPLNKEDYDNTKYERYGTAQQKAEEKADAAAKSKAKKT